MQEILCKQYLVLLQFAIRQPEKSLISVSLFLSSTKPLITIGCFRNETGMSVYSKKKESGERLIISRSVLNVRT